MVCRDCGRTIDVLRPPLDGGTRWEGRAERDARRNERRPLPRPTGFFPRHLLVGHAPDALVALLADPAFAVAYCHPDDCGRVIPLDLWDVARQCEETEGDRFEV